ncbi:type II toxin-antitoxin system VapC family toxin [Halomicrobium salinisoli]|uniref:type II toxin-antitoxin system VapC family toxin n=1 Tax=Halomicrobium salinisoli TaxID=2878391 RepID=UPI001CF02BA5|nr:PIN domain-containing protein [Halomicrobium salinisoli]
MSDPGATPLFVDTGAFYARADTDDAHHDDAVRIFDAIRSGELPYRPLYTSQAVLSEFATLALYKLGHETAVRGLKAVRQSGSFNVVSIGEATFASAVEQFRAYDDQQISFVDHTTAVLATERDIDHVFAFDSDFRALEFSLVPEDVQLPGE